VSLEAKSAEVLANALACETAQGTTFPPSAATVPSVPGHNQLHVPRGKVLCLQFGRCPLFCSMFEAKQPKRVFWFAPALGAYKPRRHSSGNRFMPIRHTELRQYIADMKVHGSFTDAEHGGDLA